MPFTAEAITLTSEERAELEQMTQSRTLPAGDVFRARLVLLLAEGLPYRSIQQRLDTSANHCAVATPVPKTAHRWSAGDPSSRPETVGHHSDAPGESVGGDEAQAQRRVDPLVLSEIGQVPEGQ